MVEITYFIYIWLRLYIFIYGWDYIIYFIYGWDYIIYFIYGWDASHAINNEDNPENPLMLEVIKSKSVWLILLQNDKIVFSKTSLKV